MKREDLRRENARALAQSAGGPAEFGRKTGMDNSQVSQLIGKTPKKNIGNIIARRIEEAFALPAGALDLPVEEEARPSVEPASPAREAEFQLHWLNRQEAEHLAEFRALTERSKKTLRLMLRNLERQERPLGAVDQS
jgi:transcriptional regulator with XRE-family HTH domain